MQKYNHWKSLEFLEIKYYEYFVNLFSCQLCSPNSFFNWIMDPIVNPLLCYIKKVSNSLCFHTSFIIHLNCDGQIVVFIFLQFFHHYFFIWIIYQRIIKNNLIIYIGKNGINNFKYIITILLFSLIDFFPEKFFFYIWLR